MNCVPSLVVGYGNPLRGDDGIGVRVARLCAEAGDYAIAAVQLLPEHAEAIASAERVVFVDCHLDLPPGTVAVMPIEHGMPSLHEASSPASLLELARHVYGAAPIAHLIGVGPASLDFGEGLSDVVEAAIPRVLDDIRSLTQGRPAPRSS